jgi:hypothetical protein
VSIVLSRLLLAAGICQAALIAAQPASAGIAASAQAIESQPFALIRIHGVRNGRAFREPHCEPAWHPQRGMHRHPSACQQEEDDDDDDDNAQPGQITPPGIPQFGCRFEDGQLRCGIGGGDDD